MQNTLHTNSIIQKITTICYQDARSTIGWIENERMVYTCVKGFLRGENFRKHNMTLLEVLHKFRATRLLSNLREFHVISVEDQQWAREVLVPLLAEETNLHGAYIAPVSALAHQAIDQLAATARNMGKGNFYLRSFEDESTAHQWLLTSKMR